MNLISEVVSLLKKRARANRRNYFINTFAFQPETKVLDLGSADGSHIASIIQGTCVLPKNVYIADIDEQLIDSGHKKYNFNPVLIGESGKLPFEDGFFDIVFCSSTIEHVTIPKGRVWELSSGNVFKELAYQRQYEFAIEITRLGKFYFVQSPNRWFPIESHTWLPMVGYLPRRVLLRLLRMTNRFWVKKTSPDWNLLTTADMEHFFPEATIYREKWLGLTKSIIAVKR